MEETLETLLKRNRMSVGEMTMNERLMRQRNTILQRQLDVSLQILDKEGRASQKNIDRLVNEYSAFLNDLPCRWVDLETYTQPNTRALRKKLSRNKRSSQVSSDGSPSEFTKGPQRPDSSRPASVLNSTSPRLRPKSSPPRKRELPKFNTCIEVLDDIIQNHSLRKKTNRHRRIGLVMPPSVKENDVADVSHQGAAVVRVRPASCNITSVSTRGTAKELHQRIRPHTAQPLHETVGTSQQVIIPKTQEIRRPQSGVLRTKRPKSAPPKYELYGRSPAVPKRTVAGIMAEMHSRRAATRDMLGKSKQLQKYISTLSWADI